MDSWPDRFRKRNACFLTNLSIHYRFRIPVNERPSVNMKYYINLLAPLVTAHIANNTIVNDKNVSMIISRVSHC